MSVSEEGERDGIGHQRCKRVADADQIFVFVEGGAVDELYVRKFVDLQRTLRKFTEPLEIFGKASGLKEESQFELNRWVV